MTGAAEQPAPTLAERFEETRAKAVDRVGARAALAELRGMLSTGGRMPQRDERTTALCDKIESAL